MAPSDHYEMVVNASLLDGPAEAAIDKHMANRWKTLLSVDDVVAAVFETLEATHTLNNTIVFYTSDHVGARWCRHEAAVADFGAGRVTILASFAFPLRR